MRIPTLDIIQQLLLVQGLIKKSRLSQGMWTELSRTGARLARPGPGTSDRAAAGPASRNHTKCCGRRPVSFPGGRCSGWIGCTCICGHLIQTGTGNKKIDQILLGEFRQQARGKIAGKDKAYIPEPKKSQHTRKARGSGRSSKGGKAGIE